MLDRGAVRRRVRVRRCELTPVFGLDDHLTSLADGGGLLVALAVALLIGLRHATDPDHLTAVSTLVLSDDGHGTRRALRLGLAWGAGHAATVVALGLPVVLFSTAIPERAQQAAELLVAVIIVGLGARLIVRWHRGYLHVHPHAHGGAWHAHPHVHEGAHHVAGHDHAHAESVGRTARAAFGIGLVHGVGGSAGVGILLIGAISSPAEATAALLLFASATALSMGLASAAFGRALTSGVLRRRFEGVAPAFGTAALAFGCWYGLAALGAMPAMG